MGSVGHMMWFVYQCQLKIMEIGDQVWMVADEDVNK